MRNDGVLGNESFPYKMKASISSEDTSLQNSKGLTTFDYHYLYKYRNHFFVFAEDAKNYLETRYRYHKNWYSIGEFEISDEIAVEHSGLGVDYKKRNFPLLEIAITYGNDSSGIKRMEKLNDILTTEEKEEFTRTFYQGNQEAAEVFFDAYYRIRDLDYTGNLFEYNDPKIEEKYRDCYERYQKLWPEFVTAYSARLEDNNQRIYTVSEPDLAKREKILKKCNLIK